MVHILHHPEGSGASGAYQGFIRPFSDDATARRALQSLEEDQPLHVSGGRLDADPPGPRDHPLAGHLIDMAVPFTVLLLEFPGSEHARTYLLDPPMVPGISESPHLRKDKPVNIDGESYSALCVYSGSLHRFESGRSRTEQLLDQTAIYLAKYLIWLRTRRLYRRTASGLQLVRSPRSRERFTTSEVFRSPDLFWNGYWPGRIAPAGPQVHLATIKPEDECWCWSGDRYGECCRPKESAFIAAVEYQRVCAQTVRDLMAAVHARLRTE